MAFRSHRTLQAGADHRQKAVTHASARHQSATTSVGECHQDPNLVPARAVGVDDPRAPGKDNVKGESRSHVHCVATLRSDARVDGRVRLR
jgi:hypothetical protein